MEKEEEEYVRQCLIKPPPWEGAAESERVLLRAGPGMVAARVRMAVPRRRRSLIMMGDMVICLVGGVCGEVWFVVVLVCDGGVGEIGWNIESVVVFCGRRWLGSTARIALKYLQPITPKCKLGHLPPPFSV